MRQPGWYWVKMDGEWYASQYRPRHIRGGDGVEAPWSFGILLSLEESRFDEIGPRIPTPGETDNTYLQAADEMLVVAGIGTADPDDDLATAKRKLGELIDWHVAVALDERVNGGYRLVPVEPTPEMMQAGYWSGSGDVSVNESWARREVWNRMLAAAPKPEDS